MNVHLKAAMILLIPIAVVLTINAIGTHRKSPTIGHACYTHQDVHPFSRSTDTVEVTVCFRTGTP